MRCVGAVALLFCALLAGQVGAAEEGPDVAREREVAAARRQVEAAELRLRRYVRVEHPLKLRTLESQIKLTQIEVDRLRELLAEYEQIAKNTVPAPLIVSRHAAELALTAAELRLADLDEERLLLARYHADQRRLYELDLESAQAALATLLPNDE